MSLGRLDGRSKLGKPKQIILKKYWVLIKLFPMNILDIITYSATFSQNEVIYITNKFMSLTTWEDSYMPLPQPRNHRFEERGKNPLPGDVVAQRRLQAATAYDPRTTDDITGTVGLPATLCG